ncbi:MAG: histidinol-phosphate transaminase [Coprobacter sp.]|nr:histidinol-phosphate transaminase [Coprobacter sp.]
MDLEKWVRPNIWNLKPYSSARDEFKGEASVFLDANENPYNAPYNRYPDPLQWELKKKIAEVKGVKPESIFLGVGSDECIDVLFRAFCEPGIDNVLSVDPTYGMYKVCADINNVEYRAVCLNADFDIDVEALLDRVDEHTKVIFLCSPNNPSGNLLSYSKIERVLDEFDGIVAVDEAYIDFADTPGFLPRLGDYDNLVVMHTFSKAWGSAAARLGMAFASSEMIAIFNKIKYPYNINLLTQQYAMQLLDKKATVREQVEGLKAGRVALREQLSQLPIVRQVYNSDANFLLVRVDDACGIYNYLVDRGVIVRNRHKITLCGNCLRITIGTPAENDILIDLLNKYTR